MDRIAAVLMDSPLLELLHQQSARNEVITFRRVRC